MSGLRVLVCGGRDYIDRDHVRRELTAIHSEKRISVVMHGGSSGADSSAGLWANCKLIEEQIYDPEWIKYGKAAGPIRNQRMLDEGKPNLVLAFPGGRGTEDMVRRAEKAGVEVRRCTK